MSDDLHTEPQTDLHTELQAHATSLRSLARDLLHDSHAAEDVTQQTLTKAWTSQKELQPGPMGGWLQRVLTNFTRRWRRGERRRMARETRQMIEQGAENQPSPAETLARREALQSVSNAVLQLDEPYQTAVFLPIAHMTGIRPDSGEVGLTCASSHSGVIRVQPSAGDGGKLKSLRLRLRHVATGFSRGVRVPQVLQKSTDSKGKEQHQLKSVANGPWQQEHLPTGFYEVEMWLAGCGPKSLGRHWVDGNTDTDLGMASLAAPGLVHFDVPDNKTPDDLKVEISALRKPFDVRIESLHTLMHDVQLAAGNYVLATQRGEQPPQFQMFEMRSGQTTTLRIAW